MSGKPKPAFWLVFVFVIAGLVGFGLYRANFFGFGDTNTGKTDRPKPISSKRLIVEFYSSSAKKNWIDEMTARFNRSQTKVDDHVIEVKAHHVTSGGSYNDLKNGKIKPDIWSPGDESWLRLAASHWREVKQETLYDGYTPLVNIPLVIAMWEPMARVLGYPGPIGWKDIAKVAADPEGWAALGHPEWGRFRWGHAHPDANSGFLTIISEVYAVLGKTDGITPEDLKNPVVVTFLEEFEGAVEHYGLSNSWIDELMHKKGPAYLSATVQYENTIIQTNEEHKNKPFKLVAIYPKEGNFWTRHPAAIIKEKWMTPEKEAASKKFIEFLTGPEAQETAMNMGLRPIREGIEMGKPFDADHGVMPKTGAELAFEVPEESVLKRIRDLWENVKVPATVVMIIDRSSSMEGEPMDNAKEGAVAFIRNMKPRDNLQVVFFNEHVRHLSELCSIRDCGEELIGRVNGIFAVGKTALHDATLQYYRKLIRERKKDPKRRYALLVLSDGKDTASEINRHDFLDALPKGEDFDSPKIYTIAYGSKADNDLLANIANRTNAKLFVSSPEEIARTYKELSANF